MGDFISGVVGKKLAERAQRKYAELVEKIGILIGVLEDHTKALEENTEATKELTRELRKKN